MGGTSAILMELVEVVHLSARDSSRNTSEVIWSVGLESLVVRRDDYGRDGQEVAPQSWERLASPPYDIYIRDNPWPIPKQPR